MDPSTWPQLAAYPAIRKVVERQIDMQFGDLRALLRLPVAEIDKDVGCNLTTATLGFNLVAGASVLFYDSHAGALTDRGDRGRRFKEVFERYYPWSPDDLEPAVAAEALWEWARSPLAHSAGVGKERRQLPGAPSVAGQPVAVVFTKGPLKTEEVAHLATVREQDPVLPPTVALIGDVLDVNVLTLSWGVHELYRRLFEDEDEANRAERTMRDLLT
jgi:hypothetical protein